MYMYSISALESPWTLSLSGEGEGARLLKVGNFNKFEFFGRDLPDHSGSPNDFFIHVGYKKFCYVEYVVPESISLHFGNV